jgi:anti-sigma regulatory factor (Ser/Thr protein kinase)
MGKPLTWQHRQIGVAMTPEQVRLPADARSVSAARQAVLNACANVGLPAEFCDSMLLLTSETVTNAVLYGRSEIRLTVRAMPGGMRVEVGDDNSRLPMTRSHEPTALDGRGMHLIEALSSDWGVEPADVGKVVWFELSVGTNHALTA